MTILEETESMTDGPCVTSFEDAEIVCTVPGREPAASFSIGGTMRSAADGDVELTATCSLLVDCVVSNAAITLRKASAV